MTPTCASCTSEDLERLEEVGAQALSGVISWREASRQLGLTHHQGLKNHMEKHYVTKKSSFTHSNEQMLIDACAELEAHMRTAPAELKPLYAVAIRNLTDLWETKPSQQNLINALKGIHEITGMKLEQRFMLESAKHMKFIEGEPLDELEAGDIVEAEVVG